MVKNKAIMLFVLIGIALVIGYNGFSSNFNNRGLSHDELTNYINQYWFQGKAMNFNIELEKDVDDLHLLLLSYQQNPNNSSQQTGLAVFKVLPNDKYKYDIFFQSSPVVVLNANKGTSSVKSYGVVFGIITDNQPIKYLITIDGKEFTDAFEKNKYFIKEYDLNTQTGILMRPIYE